MNRDAFWRDEMKKVLLATLMCSAMASPVFADDMGSGTVTFTGSIIDAPCGIAPESVDQTIKLGQIAKSALTAGGTSTPVPFTIELIDCDATTQQKAAVTFTGNVTNPDGDNDSLVLQGTAKGAGVVISGLNGLPVKFNRSGTPADDGDYSYIQDGDNTLLFSAYLRGLNDDTANPVTPGSFTAVTNFTMSYP